MHNAFSDMVHVLFMCNVCTGSCPAVADQGYHGKFFFVLFLFFCFDFVPFAGDPRECRGDETYMNAFFTTCMVRPGWGATGNSGQELTRGCYAVKHKYHLPCPPPPLLQFFFCQHTDRKNVYRDEGVILSHICWGPGAPLPFSRPQTPPRPSPPPPPPP